MEMIDGKPVNVDVAKRDFKYYIFDWDDNILHMPTRIHMEKLGEDGIWRPTSVSTGTFALVRSDEEHYRMPLVGGREAAFRDFQDEPKIQMRGFAVGNPVTEDSNPVGKVFPFFIVCLVES